jgi:hypothetical protein
MMNTRSVLLAVTALSLLNACSDWSKEPANGFDNLNTQARTEQEQILWEKQNPTRPVPPQQVPVIKEVIVPYEVTKDNSTLVISAEDQMDFTEGKSMTYKVRTSTTLAGLKFDLKADGLPQGATFEKSAKEKDTYTLTWNPSYSTVRGSNAYEKIEVKFYPEISSSSDPKDAAKLKGLTILKNAKLVVFKSQEAPSELKVEGLAAEVNEGDLVTFSVTVKVPGSDKNSVKKPELYVGYDNVSASTGNTFLELDGSRHVVSDLSKKEPEYLGDFKWKFTRIFDTKYITVQPQLGKDGKVMLQANGTRVRLSFKVVNGNNIGTEAKLVQVKINSTKPVAAPAEKAPAVPVVAAPVAQVQVEKK